MAVVYDPFTLSSSGQIQIACHSRWAFNVLATEAVEVIKNIR